MTWVWHRFLTDFWPPDASTVGPNLVASGVCTAGLYVFHLRKQMKALHEKLDRHGEAIDALRSGGGGK